MGSGDHDCEWREQAESLAIQLDAAQKTIAAQAQTIQAQSESLSTLSEQFASVKDTVEKLQRHVFGKRSEKITPLATAIRDPARAEADRIAALQTRRENAEKKRQLVTRKIEHKVREDQKVCPKCGGHEFSKLGDGAMSELFELVPAIVERQLHIQEKLRCKCGETVITADGPTKVFDKARVGPTFMAQVAVSKCADALPLHRQAKAYRRVGVQVNDSTLGDYFHRTAEITKPISDRLLDVIAEKEIVLADETSHRVQAKGKTRRSWLWSFIAKDEDEREMIAYVFSPSRSSETPDRVLEGTAGKLVADAYKGYDRVTLPGRRVRAGCLAHVRRKFFDGQSVAPDAAIQAMVFILEVYRIERAALDADLLGTPEHLEMRQTESRAVMENFKAWLDAERPRHPPKGPMGEAISYAVGQWDALTLFLTDPHLPIDNNASERALRVAALGRKNFLFVGTNEAGENRAGLYSLIATCEANGVNPVDYLADVLIRVQTHPASRIDELLPYRWKPAAPQ
ncbi:IS66 family transposase [Anaeromyxobacter sp. SG64]|uniref:IS66 family transposase n=1 Tax=Anaeromyxobacter sp. SG64 TaxID=2925409 RepID=UPI001F5818AA|nr:IS66 family transposase [Anaeromyxobacter sp. SG64]